MEKTKKTIMINPELFKIGKKNKTIRSKPTKPLINPKLLKRTLIKRIKDHSRYMIETKSSNTHDLIESTESRKMNEFEESYQALSEMLKNKGSSKNINSTTSPIQMNYIIDREIPHGCLKNGKKPCYRSWKSLKQKPVYHNEFISPIKNDILIDIKNDIESEINKAVNGEVIHSSELLQKLDKNGPLQISDESICLESIDLNNESISEVPLQSIESISESISEVPLQSIESISEPDTSNVDLTVEPTYTVESGIQIKKTIKRRYILGKSKNTKGNKYIGVLIRNKFSRKKALDATKEMKKLSSEDIKKYLREHGFIKVGSSAPTEICRKMYENCKMAGDIENTDKNIILHNLINSDTFEA